MRAKGWGVRVRHLKPIDVEAIAGADRLAPIESSVTVSLLAEGNKTLRLEMSHDEARALAEQLTTCANYAASLNPTPAAPGTATAKGT